MTYAIAFDTETTGLLQPELSNLGLQPYLIEIYCCIFEVETAKILKEFETFIRPPIPIPAKIIEITGITDDDVKKAPSFVQIIDNLSKFFLGQDSIFAHNCSFDIMVLVNELRRLDLQYRFPWPANQYCTVELSFPIKNKRLKLSELYKIATNGNFFENAHRAKSDVKALVRCIKWLHEEGFIK